MPLPNGCRSLGIISLTFSREESVQGWKFPDGRNLKGLKDYKADWSFVGNPGSLPGLSASSNGVIDMNFQIP